MRKGKTQDEPIDLDKVHQTSQPETEYWVKELGLSKHDEQVLSSGEWLNDQLIQAAMTLLRKQFPDQNGLQSTQILARNLQWLSSNTDFVQILHISQSHWVCASNIFSSPEVCDLYDSMPPVYSSTLTSQVAAMMKCQSPCFKLRHIDVQHQSSIRKIEKSSLYVAARVARSTFISLVDRLYAVWNVIFDDVKR